MTSHGVLIRLLLVTIATVGLAAPALAVTADEFRLRSGADYVQLCSAPATDPLYTAAIHMCHGFGAGTYQTIVAMTRHEKLKPVICPPEPPPTRNEAIARFLEWAKGNPQRLSEPAVEVVARFLITAYPCPAK
jgi:hypothetical protein